MKEASYYKKLKNKTVQCQLCPHKCVVKDGERGICRVRENRKGVLYTLVYGKACSTSTESIFKKPLYHFLPGTQAYSIATTGCNLSCLYCQNYGISQARPEDVPHLNLSPETIVKNAVLSDCKSVAYTFTEPVVFYEYTLDTAKIARKKRIKNVIVSNGFINPEPLKELCKYIDSANIDFKSMNPEFYEKLCKARLEPVLETIKTLHEKKVWLEVTNLIIPGHNDKESDIKKVILWIKKNLGLDVPLHLSAFYPAYKMLDVPRTSPETIVKARKMALAAGLNYVYTGNILDEEGSTTFCPKCKKPVIKRMGFSLVENKLVNGKCPFCNEKIAGVWK